MTEQQEVAIERPCPTAEACQDPRYFWLEKLRGQGFSVGLTLNIGYE
jgi:hypothetical protein